MSRIDLDENVSYVVQRPADGVGQTEERRKHRLGIRVLRQGEPSKLAHAVTATSKALDHVAVGILGTQAKRPVETQGQRPNRGLGRLDEKCDLAR